MPDPLELAAEHHAARLRLADSAAATAARVWVRLDSAAVLRSWTLLAARLLAAVAAAQEAAASAADGYIAAAMAAQNLAGRARGRVIPGGFAGAASDGRDLLGLLLSPAYTALAAVGRGYPVEQALLVGAHALDAIVRTQVSDAGRIADQVAIAARRKVGYVRMASPPCCARCAILAGRHYRWSDGFQRHPRCDCVHIPAAEDTADDLRTDPRRLFEQGQIRGLSAADTKAISSGADMARILNAQRGMYTAGGRQYTTEAAGRLPRLTPEQIYREAGDDQTEAVRLLRRYGYIT